MAAPAVRNVYRKRSKTPVEPQRGDRSIQQELAMNLLGTTPVAPLGLIESVQACSIHLSPRWGYGPR